MLRDMAKLKENTSEQELAREFLEYFCNINKLDRDGLLELDGAFRQM